jgi:hypothetical protein
MNFLRSTGETLVPASNGVPSLVAVVEAAGGRCATTPAPIGRLAMRFLDWAGSVNDAVLLVVATTVLLVPDARGPLLTVALHVLFVVALAVVIAELRRAKSLSTPLSRLHTIGPTRPNRVLSLVACVLGAVALAGSAV